jgi:hypothetical protein
VEWPSSSMTTRGWTPCASSSEAAVVRNAWKGIAGSPAASGTLAASSRRSFRGTAARPDWLRRRRP